MAETLTDRLKRCLDDMATFVEYDPADVVGAAYETLELLAARLTTAEQERNQALGQLHYVPDDWRYTGRLRAAEARVEELQTMLGKVPLPMQAAIRAEVEAEAKS